MRIIVSILSAVSRDRFGTLAFLAALAAAALASDAQARPTNADLNKACKYQCDVAWIGCHAKVERTGCGRVYYGCRNHDPQFEPCNDKYRSCLQTCDAKYPT